MMFVDDCVIIEQAARNIKCILDHYCKVSSQLVNYHKSEIQVPKDINKTVKKESIDILQITQPAQLEHT